MKRSGCLWVIIGGILFFSILLNLALFTALGEKVTSETISRKSSKVRETVLEEGSSTERIALIRLNGMIMGSGGRGGSMVDTIDAQLRHAVEDPTVRAIVLEIDSPGGEVTASDLIYNTVVRAREKKPVVISMGSMATSGGYYIACGGNWIVANETTFTGSIGVIIQAWRYNDMLAKIGMAPVTFKSGKMKDTLNGTREMTEEEKAYIQHIIMETYGKFVGIVARERKLDEGALREGVADGRIVTGKDAMKEKLVDQLGELRDAVAKAKELGNAPKASVVEFEASLGLGQLFRFLGESRSEKLEISLGGMPHMLEPGRAYLLPSIYAP